MEPAIQQVVAALEPFTGYIYPNEYYLQWELLIVLYPYLTGLVAGAFILASLERVFHVKALLPVYRLALLSALAFLIAAPLPLMSHLGHPERAWEMLVTPHTTSAMAMFGFVYAWYLLVVLLLEIWFDYRVDIIKLSNEKTGFMKLVYKVLTLGTTDVSPEAVKFDDKVGKFITVVGIPSAFMLHGYVGFIFGSIKANPWWSSVLMPVVFLFSAIVSGMAMVMLIYMVTSWVRWKTIDMACVNKLAEFLIYVMLVDFTLEFLDFIHRLYESEESIQILSQLITDRLFISLILLQVLMGGLVPLVGLLVARFGKFPDEMRKMFYFVCGVLIQVGIFSMRWNVVIGGQMFSKSLRGLTVYKVHLLGLEGLLMAIVLLVLPLVVLAVLLKLLPPWLAEKQEQKTA